ncbi:MAG: ATP-binding protein [Fulvivirga sp.]
MRVGILWLVFMVYGILASGQNGVNWAEALKTDSATLHCFWFDSEPFIYPSGDSVAGIEYDMINKFVAYTNEAYNTNISINWIRCNSFKQAYDTLKNIDIPNAFGASAFSITPERAQEVSFTSGYIPDLSVIVSDYNLPIAYNEVEFDSIFNGKTAISIRQTTFEQHLADLRAQRNIKFDINYISSSSNLINTIAQTPNSFGYIDLPTYLNALQDTINVKRQYLFSFSNQGIGFILPINSDWSIPFTHFFNQENFGDLRDEIIANHFGVDVPFLINNIASGADISSKDEVLLLTKEKEIQSKELLESALAIQRENLTVKGFVIGTIVLVLVSVITFNQYRLASNANKMLNEQKVEIENQNKQLVDLNTEKNNLISILAHDLRAPINNIEGLASLLELDGTKDDRKEYIAQIQKSTKRLSSMIEKILDVESIESNRTNLSIENISLKEVIDLVIAEFEEMARKKYITLSSEVGNENLSISGDKIFTQQIVQNLVSNALKFSKKGTSVVLKLKESQDKAQIIVSDEGPGISKAEQAKLFNKFQRLSAKPTAGEQSTGLGLSIVKKYVDLMNGSISCISELGKGTDFIVEFKKV